MLGRLTQNRCRFFSINRRSKTLFESLLPEKKAKYRQESGFEAYFGGFCPNTLLVYFETVGLRRVWKVYCLKKLLQLIRKAGLERCEGAFA